MQIKNKKYLRYDIELDGSYVIGDAKELSDVLNALRVTLSDIFEFMPEMESDEIDVIAESVNSIRNLINKTSQYLILGQEKSDISPQLSEENQAIEEFIKNKDDGEDEWSLLKLPYPTPLLNVPGDVTGFSDLLVYELTHTLMETLNKYGTGRAIRQIHIVESHLLLMRMMGIRFVDPKNELGGFSRLVNDVHALRILSRPSSHFLMEPIRGYRNAETSGKIITAVKIPNEADPGKVNDYFSFVPNRGEANTVRELSDVGLVDLEALSKTAEFLVQLYPSEVLELRSISARVEETLNVLPN